MCAGSLEVCRSSMHTWGMRIRNNVARSNLNDIKLMMIGRSTIIYRAVGFGDVCSALMAIRLGQAETTVVAMFIFLSTSHSGKKNI